jgi:predicted transposase/invertase (TIGR01784 family)
MVRKRVTSPANGEKEERRRSKLLSASLDFAFKRLFGERSKRRILECLLNSILDGNPRIENLEIDNSEIARDREEGKDVRLDIRARTPEGDIVTIEIQCINRGEIINRSAFYQARLMEKELRAGESYDSLPSIISIWIADYPATQRKHHTSEILYMYRETAKDPREIATSKFRTFIIELPKLEYKNKERLDMFTIWMMFLKHPEMITREIIDQVPEVGEAMHELENLSLDPDFRERYEARQKIINDEYSAITVAKRMGRKEGEEMGLRKGEEMGLRKGKEEERKEIALSLLKKGLPLNIIAECTGLTENEIFNL